MTNLTSRKIRLALIAVIGLLLAALIWLAFYWTPKGEESSRNNQPATATQPPLGGDFTLQGADGPVALGDYRGKVVLVYFGYTFCPDVCPTALSLLAQALSGLTPDELERTGAIFISVDPDRDTTEVLKAYPPFFHPKIVGASGTPDQVAKVARLYGASYMKQKPDSDGLYSVDHSSFTYVIDPDGKLAAILPHGTPPQEIITKIRSLLTGVKHG